MADNTEVDKKLAAIDVETGKIESELKITTDPKKKKELLKRYKELIVKKIEIFTKEYKI